MSSPPRERRTTLTSSTQLSASTSIHVHRSGHDAAASICAHLIVNCGLSRVRIAHAVGLPALVIEESIKNGVSSATLRAQLRNWLYEVASASSSSFSSSPSSSYPALPQRVQVPAELLTQLQEDCAADEIDKQRNQRNGIVSSFGADGSSFSALDPVSQAHFTNLQRSVGQSFISILNDPGEPTTNVDWSTWLGGKLYDAFDFNGRVGTLEDLLRTFRERQVGPESAAALLAEHPPSHDFSAYVRLISDAYQANRREGIANGAGEWREETADGATPSSPGGGVGVAVTEDGGPWPHGVPPSFFDKTYEAAAEMVRMSEEVGELTPAAAPIVSPTPTPTAAVTTSSSTTSATPSAARRASGGSAASTSAGGAAAGSAARAAQPPTAPTADTTAASLLHVRHIVDHTTFTDDFEYLEARNKELRAWEGGVEKCLLQHVKHRSEDFFATSQTFGTLSSDARSVLIDAQIARDGGMRAGEHFVSEYLRIGQLYRRRQNFVQLQRTATTAQRVLRRLGDVENWTALPERDLGEVLTITTALIDLEAAGKNVKDSASSISWHTLSKLQCLAEVPARVTRVRKALQRVVLEEYARALQGDLSDGDAGERMGLLCTSATRLGVLNAANQLYHVKVVEALHTAAQEALVGLLMNTGTLDDAHANELLAVASNVVAFAQPDARQQLCGFAKNLRFRPYQQLLQQFVEVLIDFLTHVSLNWGFFLTGGLRRALENFDNQDALMAQLTRDLFTRLCGEAETLVASMLEVYAGVDQVSSAADMEMLVRTCTQFPLRITTDVASRIASLLDGGTPSSSNKGSPRRSSRGTGSQPAAEGTSASSARGGEPIGFAVYRPTRVIGTTIQRLAKRFLRRQHKDNKEKITMVTEGETWVAKDSVDAAIQRDVEEMCTLSAAALEHFRLYGVKKLAWTTTTSTSGAAMGGEGPMGAGVTGTYHHQRGAASLSRSGNIEGAEELLDTDATKLYVRLPRANGLATASTPNTSTSYPFSSSTTPHSNGAGGAEEEEAVEEEGRLVANSLLVLMDLLHHYHAYLATFPFLAFDVASRMIELIDAYEGQTAAMVLGARAVEKKTLTTITTQHLCVASQCVSFLSDFVPALQAHLTAAMSSGSGGGGEAAVVAAASRQRVPRDAVAVAAALGLIPNPSVQTGESGGTANSTTTDTTQEEQMEKTKLFVDNDWHRVVKNCRAHRNEFFSKMGSLVYRKVESLGSVSVQKHQWTVGGNEWVMAMLREVARLMRALRPLLPPADLDGVVVPLIGMLSVMLREATSRIPATAVDDRAAATSDMMLFKANVEKFGYDVLTCAKVTSVSAAMQGGQSFAPVSSEEAVLAWFLPTPTAASAAAPPQRATVSK